MKKQMTTRAIVLTGMFTAILAVLSILEIPMPSGVPITLQTFAVALCGYVLGWRLGTGAVALYLLVGAVGVPVFAGMSGGIGFFAGPSGGFLFGFLILACLCGLGVQTGHWYAACGLGVTGLLLCHLAGVLQFELVTGSGFVQSLMLASVPFLLKDILSVVGALLAGGILRERLARARLLPHGRRTA